MKPIFYIILISLSLIACKTQQVNKIKETNDQIKKTADNLLILKGQLKQQGITTYQYGSHTLNVENRIYALTSRTIDLNKFINKKVQIKGIEIDGYPIDGRPNYILVKSINTINQ